MLVVVFMFATAPTSTQASPQRLQSFLERAYTVCTYFDVLILRFVCCFPACLMLFLAEPAFLSWRQRSGVVVRSCVMVRASDLDVP
jgi:hypothetical protein